MSFLARNALRAVRRSACQVRSYASAPAKSPYHAERGAIEHHALGLSISSPACFFIDPPFVETTDLWRKISRAFADQILSSFFVCVPAIAVCVAWVYNSEVEHKQHLDHLRAENDGKLPEIPAYEYLNRRSKPYPWGMNSLFFNPEASPSPFLSNKDMSQE
ncbi:hypothetical protein C0995_011827 [Termitomyces sp. Mi166|nr:hypothetical protein C0995_011827 [Termitomyces sp. Mi166\